MTRHTAKAICLAVARQMIGVGEIDKFWHLVHEAPLTERDGEACIRVEKLIGRKFGLIVTEDWP